VTVLDPNGGIARISIESLSIELGGEFPLLRVSGAIGKRDNVQLPALQSAARHL
jgi:hypothetical protein